MNSQGVNMSSIQHFCYEPAQWSRMFLVYLKLFERYSIKCQTEKGW
jgi:hypothetical protein